MNSYKFLKKHHLRTQRDFQTAYGEGAKTYSKMFTIFLCENNLNYPRLGLSVRKKFGSAPQRNKFKRRMREIFRLNKNDIFPSVDIIIIPGNESANANFKQLEKGFCYLLGISQKQYDK